MKFAKNFLAVAALLAAVPFFTGCPSPESNARDAIAGAYGFLQNAQDAHLAECVAAPMKTVCAAITAGITYQHAVATALAIYCGGLPAAGAASYADGGVCVPVKTAKQALESAVSNLNNLIVTVKGLLGDKSSYQWQRDLLRMQFELEEQA
jgi:hypothetical protein